MNQAMVRFIAESIGLNSPQQAQRHVVTGLAISAVGATLLSLFLLVAGDRLGQRFLGERLPPMMRILLVVWCIGVIAQTTIMDALRGYGRIRESVFLTGVLPSLMFALGLGTLRLLAGTCQVPAVVLLVAGTVWGGTAFAWVRLRRELKAPTTAGSTHNPLPELIRAAVPLLVTAITLYFLAQASIWITSWLFSGEQVALYGAASRLVTVVAIPLQIVNVFVPPAIAELHVLNKRDDLQRVLRTTATLAGLPSAMVLLFLIISGPHILSFLYGRFYSSAAPILVALSIGQLVNVLAGSCGMVLMMTGHQKAMMVISALVGTAVIPLSVYCGGRFGTTGIAWVAAAGLATQNLLMVLWARLRVGVWSMVDLRVFRLFSSVTEWLPWPT